MKKLLFLFMFPIVLLESCNQNPENIKLNDLVTPCDYIDALEKNADAVISIKEGKVQDDLSEKELENLKKIIGKANDIRKAMKKKFTKTELKECSNFKRLNEKMKRKFKGFY